MTDRVTFTIDGVAAEAEKGEYLLAVIRRMGIPVPTLCHHPSLEPNGACRLCVVEITHPDWKGWSGLVTSCLYPVEPGLVVSTRTDRVAAARRTLLEMYLARCPDAGAVRDLARSEGVEGTPFPVAEDADKCVMCGLCVRACQDFGPGAISSLGRGAAKTVGPRPDGTGEECVGCGACALVCPTGEIELERKPGLLSIWNREFTLPPYRVDVNVCRGCGACEEVCPLAIPRVVARRAGTFTATIAAEACVSCGLCAGACPTGAIARDGSAPCSPEAADTLSSDVAALPRGSEADRGPVFACARSKLPDDGGSLLVPCVGRVTVESLLERLARGAGGVLVMGRDRETCAYGPGEEMAADRVAAASDLAALAGLGGERVRFVVPPAGVDGPERALVEFRENLESTPVKEPYGGESFPAGFDGALAAVSWLLECPGLEPCLPDAVTELFPDSREGEETLLYLGDLLIIDRLLALLVRGRRLFELVEDAATLLELKGIAARPVMTAREVAASRATRVVVFDDAGLPDFGRPVEIVSLDSLAGAGPGGPSAALPTGGAPVKPFRFRITPQERTAMAEALKADTLICTTPHQVAQFLLLARDGTWQAAAPPEPLMAFQENVRASREEVVS